MNTKQTGDLSVAMALQKFLRLGKSVALPFGDRDRYDLILDDNGKLLKIQVKTGWEESGHIRFSAKSVTTKNGEWSHQDYKGQIDAFVVYYPPLDKLYLVPISKCKSTSMNLQLAPTKNNQKKNVNFAADFELK